MFLKQNGKKWSLPESTFWKNKKTLPRKTNGWNLKIENPSI